MDLFSDYADYIKGLPADEQEELWFEVSISLEIIALFDLLSSFQVKDAADQARAYDTNKTKEKGYRYVTKSGVLNPTLKKDDKSEHGINHPQMLRAIVPMSILYKHGTDPK